MYISKMKCPDGFIPIQFVYRYINLMCDTLEKKDYEPALSYEDTQIWFEVQEKVWNFLTREAGITF
jgi:hypothetical protein